MRPHRLRARREQRPVPVAFVRTPSVSLASLGRRGARPEVRPRRRDIFSSRRSRASGPASRFPTTRRQTRATGPSVRSAPSPSKSTRAPATNRTVASFFSRTPRATVLMRGPIATPMTAAGRPPRRGSQCKTRRRRTLPSARTTPATPTVTPPDQELCVGAG